MKIALGTVQFGFSYGISNTSGRTEEDQVLKILDYAWKNGINTLDTARDYGDSERIIGKFKNEFAWNIVTKTPSFSEGEISEEQLKLMRISFNNSLNNLDKRSIDTLLVHSADDLLKPGGAQLFSEMTKIKNSGFVKNIGASVYSDNQIDYLLDHYEIDVIQLPINILDQRLIKSGHLKKIKKHGIEIHARSVFMQGLLLMPLNALPPYFSKIYDNIKKIMLCARQHSMSNLEFALGFVQSLDEIDKVIVGVNTVDQLREIVDSSKIRIDYKKYSNLAISDAQYINPSNWNL